jgi:fructose transport system permease protein
MATTSELADVASAAADASTAFTERTGALAKVRQLLHRYAWLSPLLVLTLSVIVFTMLGDGRFQKPSTIGIIFQQVAVVATLAIGQTLVVLTAGVDLAVGTGMLLTHIVVAKMFADSGQHPVVALLLGLGAGIILGLVHGLLITKLGLPPFIATLGTFYMFQSLGLLYSQAKTISGVDLGDVRETTQYDGLLLWTGKTITFGSRQGGLTITVGVVMMLLLYVVFAYVLSNTAWGSHVYATGDDPEAARLAGIDVTRVLVSVYVVAGAIYAIAGWIQIGRSGSVSNNGADPAINLESVAAVVIGGTSLFGGRGRIIGTLIGALVVISFRIGLKLADVSIYWQNFAIGALIIVAVGLDQWIRRAAK